MSKLVGAWCLVLLACTATSSPLPPATADVEGTVQGFGFPDGYSTALGVPGEGSLSLLISTRVHGCGARTGPVLLRNSTELEITREAGPALHPGTYLVAVDAHGGDFMEATVRSTDGSCRPAGEGSFAQAGKVTVTEVSGERVRGSFDLTFVGAERMTGTFDAPLCVGGPAPGPATQCD